MIRVRDRGPASPRAGGRWEAERWLPTPPARRSQASEGLTGLAAGLNHLPWPTFAFGGPEIRTPVCWFPFINFLHLFQGQRLGQGPAASQQDCCKSPGTECQAGLGVIEGESGQSEET